jgi:hypothetical protein
VYRTLGAAIKNQVGSGIRSAERATVGGSSVVPLARCSNMNLQNLRGRQVHQHFQKLFIVGQLFREPISAMRA